MKEGSNLLNQCGGLDKAKGHLIISPNDTVVRLTPLDGSNHFACNVCNTQHLCPVLTVTNEVSVIPGFN